MVLGRIQRALFGSLSRVAVTGVLVLVIVLGGAFAGGLIGVPSIVGVDNEFGDVNESHTEIRTNVTVDNPNPVGAASADVSADYVVSMNGIEMARGGGDDIAVSPGESTQSFVTYMDNEKIPEWWVSHVGNGERTDVVIDANVHSGALNRTTSVADERTVETDLISEFESDETRPIDASQPLIDDPVLYVNATRANWGAIDRQQTELELEFHAYNPKRYDYATTRIGYTITMNDVVVGEGESNREHVLESGELTEVGTTTRIDNENLDEWWVTHLQNDQVTELRIEFEVMVEVPALGTTVSVPMDAMTYEETIETDIWGNEGDANGTDGAGGDGDDSSGDDSGPGDTNAGDGSSGDDGGGTTDDGAEDGDGSDDGSTDDGSDGDGADGNGTNEDDDDVLDDPLGDNESTEN